MAMTRYREARTLVRGLRRLEGEEHAEFQRKVLRLRRHFEQFNVDVSELCQWLMKLRPDAGDNGGATRAFWGFFLDPPDPGAEPSPDRRRLAIFRVAAGWEKTVDLPGFSPEAELIESARQIAERPRTPTADKLFARLAKLSDAHRLVLLKAAAEWIVARYERGCENWRRQHEEWEKEKTEWEAKHPELTPEARERFTEVFRQLQIKSKRPRLCLWERLKDLRDNCEYAGERVGNARHGPLCAKFDSFLRQADPKVRNNIKGHFAKNAREYLKEFGKVYRAPEAGVADKTKAQKRKKAREKAMKAFLERNPKAARWFEKEWRRYLETLNVAEPTLLERPDGGLPHCMTPRGNDPCEFNPHTNDCVEYRKKLVEFDEETLALEPLYREWRRNYLSGPRKPSFRYPSSKTLPMAKIFGKGFFRIDFERSVLGLRLDDMGEGEFLEFGFKPWPADYSPQPGEAEISSIHANFIGTRARVGFRFDVEHRPSRFDVSQDELDELRSRKFPRGAQDALFVEAARARLLETFDGDAEREMRVLAVDLGETGASAALFAGRRFVKCEPLRINKIEKLTAERSEEDKPKDGKGKKSGKAGAEKKYRKGLTRDHVGRHLKARDAGAAEIGKRRTEASDDGNEPPAAGVLAPHDMRRLGVHTRRMIRDWVRVNARQAIEAAERAGADLIVFESLRGFKAAGYDRLKVDASKKRGEGFFAFGRVRRKVAEKAVERGMRVVTVPWMYSSQVCSACGRPAEDKNKWQKNKRNKRFVCEEQSCPHHKNPIDSDENAARVLGRVFWGEIELPTEEEKRERDKPKEAKKEGACHKHPVENG